MGRTTVLRAAFSLIVLAHTSCSSSRRREVSDMPERDTECQCATPATGSCRLPQPPEFLNYTSPACEINNKLIDCTQVPGTTVPQAWVLSFKCNEGYFLQEIQGNNFYAVCLAGNWSPYIPTCKKMCSPLISLNEEIQCRYERYTVDCSKPMKPGTRARVKCKTSFNTQRPPYKDISCLENGNWTHGLSNCDPVCGKRNVNRATNPLIAPGSKTERSEFPWYVGLYKKNSSNQWDLHCGGSLISPHIVLTGASCVYYENTKKYLAPSEIKVGLGKYYKEWYHEEPDAVKSDVRAIQPPPRYYGEPTSFAHDIALLDLTYSVQNHTNIMPVCVDWNLEFGITPGMLGTLAGWDIIGFENSSDVLLNTQLQYIDYGSCVFKVKEEYRPYVTLDKFCAEYRNGTHIAADYGGGFTFVHNGLHYIFGVTSIEFINVTSIVSFTNVTDVELLNWLIDAKRTFDEAHLET